MFFFIYFTAQLILNVFKISPCFFFTTLLFVSFSKFLAVFFELLGLKEITQRENSRNFGSKQLKVFFKEYLISNQNFLL